MIKSMTGIILTAGKSIARGEGHVGENRYAICAIKPAFMWHGK